MNSFPFLLYCLILDSALPALGIDLDAPFPVLSNKK